jgi:hypothetical protein
MTGNRGGKSIATALHHFFFAGKESASILTIYSPIHHDVLGIYNLGSPHFPWLLLGKTAN